MDNLTPLQLKKLAAETILDFRNDLLQREAIDMQIAYDERSEEGDKTKYDR